MHETRRLNLGGQYVRIDRDIAPLIRALYDLGVQTFCSCQGSCMGHCARRHKRGELISYVKEDGTFSSYWKRISPKRCLETVSIGFCTVGEATKFINLVYRHTDPEEQRELMRGTWTRHPNRWIWRPLLDGDVGCDLGDDWITRQGAWMPIPKRPFKLSFEMMCLFPRSQLQLVTERVQQAVKSKSRKI